MADKQTLSFEEMLIPLPGLPINGTALQEIVSEEETKLKLSAGQV